MRRVARFSDRISPLSHIASIRRPVLVAARTKDPRLPLAESQQIVWRLRGRGGEVWSVTVRDEEAARRSEPSLDAYLQTVAMFLAKLAKN